MEMKIEKMREGHLEEAHILNFQLGYEISLETFAENFKSIEDELYVASGEGGKVLGWIHLKPRLLLQVPCRLEIAALVVDEVHRGKGVGRQLVTFAEMVAKKQGMDAVVISSNITRTNTHRFYESCGYENNKTSKKFIKELV